MSIIGPDVDAISLAVYRIEGMWGERLTWSQVDALEDLIRIEGRLVRNGEPACFTVTEAVIEWSSGETNAGFAIKEEDERESTARAHFYSRESREENQPTLTVRYQRR